MSMGQVMRIIYLSMTRLASKVSDREYHPKHVANMIPKSFQMTFDTYTRNGWEIEPFSMKKDACLSLRYLFGNLFPESHFETWWRLEKNGSTNDTAPPPESESATQEAKSNQE